MMTITDIASVPRDGDRDPRVRALQESATNTGSLLLWGSSAYPRMDRAEAFRSVGYVPRADSRRMLVVGYAAGPVIAYSRDVHPTLGLRTFEFDTIVVR